MTQRLALDDSKQVVASFDIVDSLLHYFALTSDPIVVEEEIDFADDKGQRWEVAGFDDAELELEVSLKSGELHCNS